MKVITEIRESKKRPDRFEVVAEDEVIAILSVRDIAELGLRSGLALNADAESRARVASDRMRVYDAALRMLARAPRSMFEMRMRLSRKGEKSADINWALNRLELEGHASDASFAVQYARGRLARGIPRAAILTGLLKAAVPRTTAERAIEEVLRDADVDETAVATRLARRKLKSIRQLDPLVVKRRLAGFLKRRGFTPADIREAVRNALAEEDAE